jgi:hypothetical protein
LFKNFLEVVRYTISDKHDCLVTTRSLIRFPVLSRIQKHYYEYTKYTLTSRLFHFYWHVFSHPHFMLYCSSDIFVLYTCYA